MIGGDLFFAVVLAGIIIAHFAAGMSFQASVGRLLYALGRDNQLPRKLFGVLHPRYKTPAFNILLCGIFGCAGFALTIATATSLVNFGAFLAFSAVNLARCGSPSIPASETGRACCAGWSARSLAWSRPGGCWSAWIKTR